MVRVSAQPDWKILEDQQDGQRQQRRNGRGEWKRSP